MMITANWREYSEKILCQKHAEKVQSLDFYKCPGIWIMVASFLMCPSIVIGVLVDDLFPLSMI